LREGATFVAGAATVNLVNELSALATATDTVTVANRLRPVLLKLNRHLRREIHSLGVTGGQASMLFAIQREPGIGVNELAERERMSAPGMSKYVGRLEQAGLIEREPSADDRRRIGLRVSAEGERVLRSVRSRRTAWLAARLRDLSPGELEAVDAAIGPLQQLIDE
jgi:DNA-binding MarR family transcriptional regulator